MGPTLFAGLSKQVDLKLVSRLEFVSGTVAMRCRASSLGVGSAQGGGQPLVEAAGIDPAAGGFRRERSSAGLL
jgi:hypothetical protein